MIIIWVFSLNLFFDKNKSNVKRLSLRNIISDVAIAYFFYTVQRESLLLNASRKTFRADGVLSYLGLRCNCNPDQGKITYFRSMRARAETCNLTLILRGTAQQTVFALWVCFVSFAYYWEGLCRASSLTLLFLFYMLWPAEFGWLCYSSHSG